jgi:small-conductance mechanosensitive channel
MSKVFILLLIISVAIAAYARARREGTWSWSLFAKTVFALVVIGALGGIIGVWLGGYRGTEDALTTTLLVLVMIVVGVMVLAIWVRSKTGHRNK